MSTRTLFLSRLIGLCCVIASLTMFVRGPAFVDAVMLLLKDPPLMLFVGIVTVAAGLAMVLAHNLWSGGALTVVVTVLGWTSLIKGALFLGLAPEAEASLFLRGLH
jgi:vacuolar-type H+-ATPase subunit I/STV1